MPTVNGKFMSDYDYQVMCETNYSVAKFEAEQAVEFFDELTPDVDYGVGKASAASMLLSFVFVIAAMVAVGVASMLL